MRKNKEKNKVKGKMLKFIKDNMLEIILLFGLFFIVLASFIVNTIAGLYVLGLTLTVFSLYLARR